MLFRSVFRHGLLGIEEVPGLEAAQIEQQELRRFVIRAVAPDGLSGESRAVLARRVVEAVGFEADVRIELVDSPDAAGLRLRVARSGQAGDIEFVAREER